MIRHFRKNPGAFVMMVLGLASLATLAFASFMDDDLSWIDWIYIVSGGGLIGFVTLMSVVVTFDG